MLLKKTTQGDWETSNRNITTKGGTFVGYASSEENAKIMAAAPKLLKLLQKLHQDDLDIQTEIESIFKDI